MSLDKYTIIEKDRIRTVYNWLQYYSRETLEKELAENGFNAQAFHADVAGAAFNPGATEMAVIAARC